jgi:alkylation response protein AidB-like acyl-CoA dehydrogenase
VDLNLNPKERAFRDEVRAWLDANAPRDWAARRQAEESLNARFTYLRQWQRKLFDAGWAGISWPVEYGGRGASVIEQMIFLEEMARAQAPPMANVIGLGLVGPTIIAFGSARQKQAYLRKILSAEEIWCQGFSEPNAGSDLAALSTEARREGGYFVVNGHKCWTSYGWVADRCELLVRTDPAAPKHKGLTALLVDMHSPGIEVRGLRQMSGECEFSEIFFRDVRVPVEDVLGEVNDGWRVAIGTLAHERGTFGAALHVTYRRNVNRLVELAREMGRDGDALVRQKLAQCYAEIEIMRFNQMRAFSRIKETGVPGPEGSIQKIFWSELNQRLQQVAMEILGPYGQLAQGAEDAIDGGEWAYGYLRSRGNTIEAGTSEIQRNIIGHFVLGLAKSY